MHHAKAHRYLFQRLGHITKIFISKEPCPISVDFLRMITSPQVPGSLSRSLLEGISTSENIIIDDFGKLVEGIAEPNIRNYVIGSLAFQVIKKRKLNPLELESVVPLMADWT